jgi:lipopolysaccharide/colanic/teichoic acid biosynthesis glycosyltransferase
MYSTAKRVIDTVTAAGLLLIGSPLLLLVAAGCWFSMGRPVLWRETRIGRSGRPFTIWKFRSMTNERNASGEMLPDALRISRYGRILRSTSLDELPELWNVLRSEMSLVGPRPLLPRYLPRYSREQGRRHEVRPGITGLAQVMGRNALSWERKFELDVWYVDHCSFSLDMKILAMTVWQVATRRGISAPGEATMSEFMGSGPCA